MSSVQTFLPYSQTLQKEIQGHQPRCDDIFERSQSSLKADSPNVETIRARLADLRQLWSLIMQETEKRHSRLEEAHKAQQYYFDAAEAEAWMSEQELYMMSEEKAKVLKPLENHWKRTGLYRHLSVNITFRTSWCQ